MNYKIKAAILIGSQVASVIGLHKKIKQARADNDRLALADSIISGLGVITGLALAFRTLRRKEEL